MIIKKFITPNPRPLRALFFFFLLFHAPGAIRAQSPEIDSLIRWVNEHPLNDSTRIVRMHTISYMLSEVDVKKSFAYYEQVSRLSDSLHFTYGKALANINLGILLSSSGNLEASTTAYIKAVEEARTCGASRLESIALNNIGDNFLSLKKYDKCREYGYEAIDFNMALKAWRGVAINYELLQECDLDQGLYADAKIKLDKGMPYALYSKENYVLSTYYLGYAKLHAIHHRNDSADYYFNKALVTAQKSNDLRNEFDVYLAESEYLKSSSDRDKILWLSKAMKLAEQTEYAAGRAKDAEQLSAVYNDMNSRDSSLFYYRIYRSLTDSIFSENNQRNMIVNESEWTNKKKELENNNLKQIASDQRQQILFRNILLFVGTIGFMLTLFIAFLLYKSFQAKKLRDESQYKQKIAETEMQALRAQMNPHFFFNSLNSIENFIMQNEKKLASDYLNKFARFIRSILDSSYSDLIELNKDLESIQLYIDLEQLRFNNKFIYKCVVDPELRHGEYHVPALLVQPFLENAINHGIGHSERTDLEICLKVTLAGNMIHYLIEDNGIGREQSAVYNQLNKPFHKSVGMKLSQDRINIFNRETGSSGDLKIIDLYDENDRPSGTRIEFAIKVMNYAPDQSYTGR